MFKIWLSVRVEYAIATPLVGLADESYHGGSQVITSNSLFPCFNYYCLRRSKSNSVTLKLNGIDQNCWTWDFYFSFSIFSNFSQCSSIEIFSWSTICLKKSSASESSSSKNYFSNSLICLFTCFNNILIEDSSFGKLSINTFSSPSETSSLLSSIFGFFFFLDLI